MLKKPCLKVQNLQYKFLDWKWPPPLLELFRKNIRFGISNRPLVLVAWLLWLIYPLQNLQVQVLGLCWWHPGEGSAVTVPNGWYYQNISKCIFKANTNIISVNSQIHIRKSTNRTTAQFSFNGRRGQTWWTSLLIMSSTWRHSSTPLTPSSGTGSPSSSSPKMTTSITRLVQGGHISDNWHPLVDGEEDTKNLWWWMMACLIHWDVDIYYLHLS